MKACPNRIEMALSVLDVMIAENDDQLRDILARSGVTRLDDVMRREKRRVAATAQTRANIKERAKPGFDLTPEQQAIIDQQHAANLRRLGLQPKAASETA